MTYAGYFFGTDKVRLGGFVVLPPKHSKNQIFEYL